MEKPKLLVFSDCYIYGGSERLMSFLLSNEILNEKYELNFAFRSHKGYLNDMKKDFDHMNIKTIPLSLLSNDTFFYNLKNHISNKLILLICKLPFLLLYYCGLYSIYNTFVLAKLIMNEKPTLLHINNGGFPAARTCNLLVFVASFLGIRPIIYQVNNQASKARWIDGFRNYLLNKLVTKFVSSSVIAKNTLSKNAHIAIDKIALVRNIVKTSPPELTREEILTEFNLAENTFLIVQVAFLTGRKGQINLLKSVAQLIKDSTISQDICLLLIGDGEDKAMLEKYILEQSLAPYVKLLGYRGNYTSYLNAANVVALPSVMNEDLPLVVIEALMLGKCILSASLAGISEVIENGENGILVAPDPASITTELTVKLRWIMENEEKVKEMAFNALKSSASFSSKIYAQTLIAIYSEC